MVRVIPMSKHLATPRKQLLNSRNRSDTTDVQFDGCDNAFVGIHGTKKAKKINLLQMVLGLGLPSVALRALSNSWAALSIKVEIASAATQNETTHF